jgi:hypothetical protein
MGIKRRIMTSGQKYVDKHRGWLKTAGDPATIGGVAGSAEAIDVPGQSPWIDNLSVTETAGTQTFTFVAALGGVPADGDTDTVTVTLNGTVLASTPTIPTAISDDDITVGGVAYTKNYYGRPAHVAPAGTEWANSDRRALDAANTPAVANVGENTLKVAVTTNNKVKHSQTIKFTVTAASAVIAEAAGLVTADDGNNQLDTNLSSAGAHFSGIVAGDKNAWALDTNAYEIEVTKAGAAVTLAAKGAEGRTVKANAAGVANAVAVVALSGASGALAQTDLLATGGDPDASNLGLYIVTFHLLNMKGQRQYSFTAAEQEVA